MNIPGFGSGKGCLVGAHTYAWGVILIHVSINALLATSTQRIVFIASCSLIFLLLFLLLLLFVALPPMSLLPLPGFSSSLLFLSPFFFSFVCLLSARFAFSSFFEFYVSMPVMLT